MTEDSGSPQRRRSRLLGLASVVRGGRGRRGSRVGMAVSVVTALALVASMATLASADPANDAARDAAIDLGDITAEDSAQFEDVSLSGSVGDVVWWQFTLAEPKVVAVNLWQLDADADLVLEDADGNELANSRNTGTTSEKVKQSLAAGTYFVRAEAVEAGTNDFKLRRRVKPVEPATAEPRDAEQEQEEETDPDPQPQIAVELVLTVGVDDTAVPVMSGYSRWSRLGSMSLDRFEADGKSIQVMALVEHAGGLYLGLRQPLDSDFVLSVGGTLFVGSESLVPTLSASGAYWWPSVGVLGVLGDAVDVSITLEGTGSLEGRASAPPSAYFAHVPESHDGSGTIEFRLYFGESNLAVSALMLRDHALEVTGGTVSEVLAVGEGGRTWTVRVQPSGSGDVHVTLPAAADCVSADSVCSPDGRMLRNRAEAAIAGPAAATQLASLAVSGAVLDPAFDPEVSLYSAQAAAEAVQATVTATARVAGAEVQISPADADAVAVGHQVELAAGGQTAVSVSVVAADGAVRRYWLLIGRPADPAQAAPGGPPRLSALLLDGVAPLSFDPASARYETDAEAGARKATALLGKEDTDATVEMYTVRGDDPALTLNAADDDLNVPGHQFGLSASGDTLVLVIVTSADGHRQNIYMVLIHNSDGRGSQVKKANPPDLLRSLPTPKDSGIAASKTSLITPRATPDAVLSTLSLGSVVLSPAFSAATSIYTASVTEDVSQVTVSATAAVGVNYTITPADADSNTAGHQIALLAAEPGGEPAQTVFAVIVSNADGVVNSYLVSISRAAPASDDATLSALSIDDATLTPAFASDTHAYTAVVPNDTAQITVTADSSIDGADVAISPADADTNTDGHQVDLVPGANTVTVDVTATDEVTTLSYSVTITREPSDDDATLSALSIDEATLAPAFASDTHIYTAVVPITTAQVTVDLVTSHSSATVTVVPTDADPLADGYQIPLAAPLSGAQSAPPQSRLSSPPPTIQPLGPMPSPSPAKRAPLAESCPQAVISSR